MNKTPLLSRVTQVSAATSCCFGILFIVLALPRLMRLYMPHFADFQHGRPLPQITMVAFGWTQMLLERPGPMAGLALIALCVTCFVLIFIMSPNEETRSQRMLGFTTIVLLGCFMVLAGFSIGMAAPLTHSINSSVPGR